jgi:hypothetical protein
MMFAAGIDQACRSPLSWSHVLRMQTFDLRYAERYAEWLTMKVPLEGA